MYKAYKVRNHYTTKVTWRSQYWNELEVGGHNSYLKYRSEAASYYVKHDLKYDKIQVQL